MMKRKTLLSLVAIASIGAAPTLAQDTGSAAPSENARERAVRLPSIEAVMSMRDRLELTEEQIDLLDRIRAESVERRSIARAEVAEMRSRLAAGQIQRSDMMAYIEDRQASAVDERGDHRAQVEGVLNATQLEALQELRTRRRAFSRGRASVQRGGRDGIRSGQRSFRGGRGIRGSRRGGIRSGRGFRGAGGADWDRGDRRFRRGR